MLNVRENPSAQELAAGMGAGLGASITSTGEAEDYKRELEVLARRAETLLRITRDLKMSPQTQALQQAASLLDGEIQRVDTWLRQQSQQSRPGQQTPRRTRGGTTGRRGGGRSSSGGNSGDQSRGGRASRRRRSTRSGSSARRQVRIGRSIRGGSYVL